MSHDTALPEPKVVRGGGRLLVGAGLAGALGLLGFAVGFAVEDTRRQALFSYLAAFSFALPPQESESSDHQEETTIGQNESENPEAPINLYLNSPGGSIPAMLAIYDAMQFVRPAVETTCVGQGEASRVAGGGDGADASSLDRPQQPVQPDRSPGLLDVPATRAVEDRPDVFGPRVHLVEGPGSNRPTVNQDMEAPGDGVDVGDSVREPLGQRVVARRRAIRPGEPGSPPRQPRGGGDRGDRAERRQ